MRETVETRSEQETRALAARLASGAKRGDVFALIGGLGTGKTVFAKGFGAGLGITDDITSPTFTLMEIYPAEIPLYHFDLYRIERPAEFNELGFDEYWEGDGISLIEWADRAPQLPSQSIIITLTATDDTGRRITIEYPDH